MSVTFLFGAQNFLRCSVSRAVPADFTATSRVATCTVTIKLERNILTIFQSLFGNPRLYLTAVEQQYLESSTTVAQE